MNGRGGKEVKKWWKVVEQPLFDKSMSGVDRSMSGVEWSMSGVD